MARSTSTPTRGHGPIELLDLRPGARVLDVACRALGDGTVAAHTIDNHHRIARFVAAVRDAW
jgi:hypothetical protein